MNLKDFKRIVTDILIDMGFESKLQSFYKKNDDLIYVIEVQKSRHSNGVYFNVGYLIKDIHQEIDYPKVVDSDVRSRFCFLDDSGKETDIIDLNQIPATQIEYIRFFLQQNISELINPVEEHGLIWFLEKNPTLLYQTTILAKKYLNIMS